MPDIEDGAYSISAFDIDENEYILDITTPTSGAPSGGSGGGSVATSISTYDDLRGVSFLGGSPPAVQIIKCRSEIGDGGGGMFAYDPDDSSTSDDDGLTLVDSDGHRFKRIDSGPIDVRWFGAVANDSGSTAKAGNVTAFAAAVSAAKTLKMKVHVPLGDYYFTNGAGIDLTTTGSQTLHVYGDGIGRTRLLFNASEDVVYSNTCSGLILTDLTIGCTSCSRGLNISGAASNLGPATIERVEVYGCTAAPVSGSLAGMRLLNMNDITIDSCHLHGNGFANVSGDPEISGFGNGHDILIDTATANERVRIIRNLVVQSHTSYAILAYDCIRSEASENKVYGGNTPGVRAKNRTKPVHTPGVQDDASGYGICFYNHVVTDDAGNIVTNNYVEETAGTGIYLQAMSGCTVANNVVVNCARYQLDNQLPVGGIAANYGPNSFSNNYINGCGGDTGVSDSLPQGSPPPSNGYDVQGDDNVIVGGVVMNCTKHGIKLNGTLERNSITGTKINTTGSAAISNVAGSLLTDVSIVGVTINEPGGAGVAIDRADGATCTDVTVIAPGAQGISIGGYSGGSTGVRLKGCTVRNALFDFSFLVRATKSTVEHCTAPGSLLGLALGTSSTGCAADDSHAAHNDFAAATSGAYVRYGSRISFQNNRTPQGFVPHTNAIGGVIHVRGASSADHNLNGPLTEHGITYATGDRYLAKNQTDAEENGIWIIDTGAGWSRAPEFAHGDDLQAGGLIQIGPEDTSYGNSTWSLLTTGAITVGTTELTFGYVAPPDIASNVQRVARGVPFVVEADADVDEYGRVVINTTAGTAVKIPVELPNGSTLTDILLRVIGGGNADLPAVMPRFRLRKLVGNTNTTSASSASVDGSANVGAYNAQHSIVMNSIGEVIDNTVNRYMIEFVSESGANAVTGFTLITAEIYYTVTTPDKGAA